MGKLSMPIYVVCSVCNQTVAAPESMAGKKAVCPSCKAVIAIPEQFVPASIVNPDPVERSAPPPSQEIPAATDIARPAGANSRVEDERAALDFMRIAYVLLRDDWRRLATCPHLWLAFLLFFLPWVNVSCNGRTIATQTGLQTCHGAATIDAKIDKLAKNDRNFPDGVNLLRPRLDEPALWSILSIIYILFVFLAGLLGSVCIACVFLHWRTVAAGSHLFSLGLGAAAFLALSAQLLIGFPIERHSRAQLEKSVAEQQRRNAQAGMGQFPNDALDAWFDVDVRYTGWLWLSWALTLVSVPVFLVEFAILIVDAIKKHGQQQEDSG